MVKHPRMRRTKSYDPGAKSKSFGRRARRVCFAKPPGFLNVRTRSRHCPWIARDLRMSPRDRSYTLPASRETCKGALRDVSTHAVFDLCRLFCFPLRVRVRACATTRAWCGGSRACADGAGACGPFAAIQWNACGCAACGAVRASPACASSGKPVPAKPCSGKPAMDCAAGQFNAGFTAAITAKTRRSAGAEIPHAFVAYWSKSSDVSVQPFPV